MQLVLSNHSDCLLRQRVNVSSQITFRYTNRSYDITKNCVFQDVQEIVKGNHTRASTGKDFADYRLNYEYRRTKVPENRIKVGELGIYDPEGGYRYSIGCDS